MFQSLHIFVYWVIQFIIENDVSKFLSSLIFFFSQNDFEDEKNDISSTELELRQELSLTKSENLTLHDSMTAMQEKYRTMSTEASALVWLRLDGLKFTSRVLLFMMPKTLTFPIMGMSLLILEITVQSRKKPFTSLYLQLLSHFYYLDY